MEKTYADHLRKAVTQWKGFLLWEKKKGSREKRLLQSASRSIAISVRALQSSRASGMCLNTDSDSSGGVGSHACRVCGVLRSAVHKLEAREKLVHTLVESEESSDLWSASGRPRRNWFTRLWSLRSPQICGLQAGGPGGIGSHACGV